MGKDAYITADFLLETKEAQELYHNHAENLPIIDYHCHLQPKLVAEDHRFKDLSELWLAGDHYKWRAMRSNGVAENYCTGDATPREKFQKWAETVPYCLRNPLYDWTHLELKKYFGISDKLLGPDTAENIWSVCNRKIAEPGYSCRGLMSMSSVVLACTTDDPTDSLEYHRAIKSDSSFKIQVLPTWRPDKGMQIENADMFNKWVDRLGSLADVDIKDFDSYLEALNIRHDFFHKAGCRLSDHGLDTAYAADYTESEIAAIFLKVRSGAPIEPSSINKFKSAMLHIFGVMDHKKGWTQQFHIGAMRNNNSRMFAARGPDIGFDSIGDLPVAGPLSRLLDRLDRQGKLAKTILYNLNPRDNAVMATMLGNFQDGSVAGKIQFGSAWWFLDQRDGMERQIEDLSQLGLLSRFVGMLTDSRSFVSYPRHEYFRRILCNMLGDDIKRGRMPRDMKLVGRMVEDICYNNAAGYFGFTGPSAVKKENA